MNIETYIDSLVSYAMNCGLAEPEDHQVLTNRLMELLKLDDYTPSDEPQTEELEEILGGMVSYAVEKGLCDDNITAKDLFDTRLMAALTPMPREVIRTFREKYERNPVEATDWYYKFSCDTDYIRRYRIKKDMKWTAETEYGTLDITINLSKPEKDPKAIAAALNAKQSSYPKCLLCEENVGYAGRVNHPARQNHRIIPVKIKDERWGLQYSPYVYYNEHCILFNCNHTPMKIDKAAFEKLFDFVEQFPHYFIGSNADLPIVGGSILTHEHFQGGHYTFAMEKAECEEYYNINGYSNVKVGRVKWPMSVIRLSCCDYERLSELGDKILNAWRGYSDEEAFIFAETDGVPHNTITPIARKRGNNYELDLVLRNNITTDECPLGVYHPHSELHHIKKENIGLIEVMGLAVLPARLRDEIATMCKFIAEGRDFSEDESIVKHKEWFEKFKDNYEFTPENTEQIIKKEIGRTFERVLEDAGVYKRTPEGHCAFLRFIATIR